MIKIRDVIFFEDVLGHDKFQRDHKLPPGTVIMETQSLPPPDTDDEDNDSIIELVTPDSAHEDSLRAS